MQPPVPDVLTDIPGKPGSFWGDHTTLVGPARPPAWLCRLAGWGLAHNLSGALAGLRLFLRRRRAAGVVTDGGASGILFAWLQALVPWGRKPHVMVDCNWYESPSRWKTWLKGLRLRLAARSVERFVVWASHEVEDYARVFGLPHSKLEYVPFHTTLSNYEYDVRDDGYLFAGGNYDRDYATLVEAVRDLDVPAWIATTRPEQLAGVDLPAHVRVEGTSAAGFRQAVAGARLVVVPMKAGLLHSGGQQTCLNAMSLGKPTIAVGARWARDFITDGVDGLVVDYEDPAGLRRAIRWVLDHPDAARRMGERARQRAAWFTTERTMRSVYEIAKGSAKPQAAERRRVLTVVRWPVGGIRTHILYTYGPLIDAGYRFTFVLPDDGSLATFRESLAHLEGCEFVGVPVRGPRCRLWSTVRQLARQRRFGLIHSHGLTAAVHGVVGNVGAGLPHLCTLHDVFRPDQFAGWKGWLKQRLLARLVRRITSIVSVGDDVRANLLEYLPALGRRGGPRLPTIPNGIDTRRFGVRRLDAALDSCDHTQIQSGVEPPHSKDRNQGAPFLLGFMGRFMEQKGFTHLLQALEVLRREGAPRPFHLLAVGSGDCRGRYEAEIVARGLAEHVTIRDFTPDVLPLLRDLDVLVVPSLWEASPLLPMEAMAVGVPVLGSNCIGLREVLAGTPARQFRAGDVGDLVRALRDVLAEPGTEAARAFAARARARFDCRQAARRFLAEFDRLFDRRAVQTITTPREEPQDVPVAASA
jgi:glycosyltransferase involved in cell wall biosynthesis